MSTICPTMENASENISLILNPKKFVDDYKVRQKEIESEISDMIGEIKND